MKLKSTLPFKFMESGPMPNTSDEPQLMAFVFKPARAFPLMRLNAETRRIIFSYVLAPLGIVESKISITSSSANSILGARAKEYSEGMPNRLGLLRVNKEIHGEAHRLLYETHIFKFDDTTVTGMFLTRTTTAVRHSIKTIEISKYKQKSAMIALHMLADCSNLRRVSIMENLATNATPSKAAKAFYGDASHFLTTNSIRLGGAVAAVDLLRFDKQQFTIKEGEDTRQWTHEEKVKFHEILVELIK